MYKILRSKILLKPHLKTRFYENNIIIKVIFPNSRLLMGAVKYKILGYGVIVLYHKTLKPLPVIGTESIRPLRTQFLHSGGAYCLLKLVCTQRNVSSFSDPILRKYLTCLWGLFSSSIKQCSNPYIAVVEEHKWKVLSTGT